MSETPQTSLVAGKYELVALIGRGGMGTVWKARHISLGTFFAIKFIEPEYASSADARSRFDKEARAAAAIRSKHAIQVFDHGITEDGRPYIVMELLSGEPLDKRLDRVGRMQLSDVARIIGQVSRALARAHEAGIIHRDLKPENIFLVRTPDDDDEVAKVLDFGIAKYPPSQPGSLSSSTKTGAVLGTPFYMSPEQARGLKTIDARTDLWSLGVIAYRCVVGRLPFDGESVGDLLVKICTAPLPVPSQAMPDLPPSFDAWFSRALTREPEHRFQTVQELSDALAAAAGISVRQGMVAPPSFAQQGSPAATPASAAFGSQTPGPHANTSAPFTSSTQNNTAARGAWVAAAIFAVLIVALGGFAYTRFAKAKAEPAAASHAEIRATLPEAPTETPPADVADAGIAVAADAGVVQVAPASPTKKPGSKAATGKPPAAAPLPLPPTPTPTPAPSTKPKPAHRPLDPGY